LVPCRLLCGCLNVADDHRWKNEWAALGGRGCAALLAGGVGRTGFCLAGSRRHRAGGRLVSGRWPGSPRRWTGHRRRAGGWAAKRRSLSAVGRPASSGASLRASGQGRAGFRCRWPAWGALSQGLAAGGGRSVPARRLRAGSTDIGWGKVSFFLFLF
jgi:hypothetical protein